MIGALFVKNGFFFFFFFLVNGVLMMCGDAGVFEVLSQGGFLVHDTGWLAERCTLLLCLCRRKAGQKNK